MNASLVDSTIKDFIFILGAEAIREQSLPGLMEVVEKGTSSIAYNFLVDPLLKRFVTKFGAADLVNLVSKILVYPALISLMAKLIYKQQFMYAEHFVDVLIAMGAQEIYDMTIGGKSKKYM